MHKSLKIKVCGMMEKQNIQDLQALPINYMGMIFYPASKRFVQAPYEKLALANTPENILLTGVFVNETLIKLIETVQNYHLRAVQLHGDENVLYINALKNQYPKVQILKAIGISETFDFSALEAYQNHLDYFLFDTKTPLYGGSGQKFDWQKLQEYQLDTPFFLSGGIALDDLEAVQQIQHPQFCGIDLNSKFEIKPGLKDISLVKKFLNTLNK